MINPNNVEKHRKEAKSKSVLANQAWDDVDFVDLDVVDDFIQKALAIKAGEDYDTRISLSLELDEKLVIKLMQMAHEEDISLNKLIEKILKEVIDANQY
jgi:hypothetical protein